MHEEQPRLFVEHVAVDRRDPDSILGERPQNWIHFSAQQDEVSCRGGFSSTSGLKVYRGGDAHGRRNLLTFRANQLAAWRNL